VFSNINAKNKGQWTTEEIALLTGVVKGANKKGSPLSFALFEGDGTESSFVISLNGEVDPLYSVHKNASALAVLSANGNEIIRDSSLVSILQKMLLI
jgi:hypothetical protein